MQGSIKQQNTLTTIAAANAGFITTMGVMNSLSIQTEVE